MSHQLISRDASLSTQQQNELDQQRRLKEEVSRSDITSKNAVFSYPQHTKQPTLGLGGVGGVASTHFQALEVEIAPHPSKQIPRDTGLTVPVAQGVSGPFDGMNSPPYPFQCSGVGDILAITTCVCRGGASLLGNALVHDLDLWAQGPPGTSCAYTATPETYTIEIQAFIDFLSTNVRVCMWSQRGGEAGKVLVEMTRVSGDPLAASTLWHKIRDAFRFRSLLEQESLHFSNNGVSSSNLETRNVFDTQSTAAGSSHQLPSLGGGGFDMDAFEEELLEELGDTEMYARDMFDRSGDMMTDSDRSSVDGGSDDSQYRSSPSDDTEETPSLTGNAHAHVRERARAEEPQETHPLHDLCASKCARYIQEGAELAARLAKNGVTNHVLLTEKSTQAVLSLLAPTHMYAHEILYPALCAVSALCKEHKTHVLEKGYAVKVAELLVCLVDQKKRLPVCETGCVSGDRDTVSPIVVRQAFQALEDMLAVPTSVSGWGGDAVSRHLNAVSAALARLDLTHTEVRALGGAVGRGETRTHLPHPYKSYEGVVHACQEHL